MKVETLGLSKFSIYPENLEIRKHWDIKNMIIEIK